VGVDEDEPHFEGAASRPRPLEASEDTHDGVAVRLEPDAEEALALVLRYEVAEVPVREPEPMPGAVVVLFLCRELHREPA
jgi:hypothetical protein